MIDTAPDFRMSLSRVTSESPSSSAVATIRRSAGSPWKPGGSSATFAATPGDTGTTTTDLLAVSSHPRSGSLRVNLPFSTNMATSQRLMSARTGRGSMLSRRSMASAESSSPPFIHQIQIWVSMTMSRLEDRRLKLRGIRHFPFRHDRSCQVTGNRRRATQLMPRLGKIRLGHESGDHDPGVHDGDFFVMFTGPLQEGNSHRLKLTHRYSHAVTVPVYDPNRNSSIENQTP